MGNVWSTDIVESRVTHLQGPVVAWLFCAKHLSLLYSSRYSGSTKYPRRLAERSAEGCQLLLVVQLTTNPKLLIHFQIPILTPTSASNPTSLEIEFQSEDFSYYRDAGYNP
ncbi:hypothetical protein M0802_011764 [Mischocyttarus mexicanus]|nr:hypothetical protein M0802_011764 [Mischocyttarus mexicanus]